MFFRSERLFLRPGWPEDWRELFARTADEQIVRNLSRAPWAWGADDGRDFAAPSRDRRLPHFLVTLPQTACGTSGAALIGGIGLMDAAGAPELGCWIAREHWGRGYATEAGRAALSVARALGHRQVRAAHFADSPAAGRVLVKLGFRPTGRIEPRFSLVRGEQVPALVMVCPLDAASGGDDDDTGGAAGGDKASMLRAA
jgi:RimJ/RimL family protein N-acetyltransferase